MEESSSGCGEDKVKDLLSAGIKHGELIAEVRDGGRGVGGGSVRCEDQTGSHNRDVTVIDNGLLLTVGLPPFIYTFNTKGNQTSSR